MPSSVQVNLVDRSRERTSVSIPTIAVNATNIATLDGFATNVVAQIANLTLLSVAGSSLNRTTRTAYELPTDENAHREIAVRFVMVDANLNQASFSLGGPNLALFPFTIGEGGDIWQWDSGPQDADLEAFVDDVLVVARHPISGLSMTMQRLELIGRSN